MKPIIMSCFLIMGVALLISGIIRRRNKKEGYKEISALLAFCALSNLAQAAFYSSDNPLLLQASSSIYSISTIWIIFFSAVFVEKFTRAYKEIKSVRIVYHALSTIDTLLLLFNIYSPIMFKIVQKETKYGSFYAREGMTALFYAHCVFCMVFLSIPYCGLAIKTAKSLGSFFRVQFSAVFIVVSAALLASLENTFLVPAVSFTALVFGVAVFVTEYMYSYKLPHMLRDKTLLMSIQQMKDIACIFDLANHPVFLNESGERLISRENLELVIEDAVLMSQMKINQQKDHISWRDKLIVKSEEFDMDHEVSYQIGLYRLRHKNEVIGYYLIMHDLTEEIETFKRDHYRLTHDELTDLYNREYFFEKCRQMLASHPDNDFYFVLSDIDNFKLFNELYGSEKGDEVLLAEARLLRNYCTSESVYGRLNGDKFAVLVRDDKFNEQIFRDCIGKLRSDFSDSSFKIVVKAGIYKVADHSEQLMSIYNKAQLAIAAIGSDYSSAIATYTMEMMENTLNERWLLDELPTALERGEFVMYLQPQVDSATDKWIGAEALVRWISEERGMISPGEFVPLFERMGVIGRVDEVIWEQAAKKISEWNSIGRNDLYISINISGDDFYHFDIYEKFVALVEKYKINPKQLKLEITESFMVSDAGNRKNMLEKLRDYGFYVEIDDFGSGYSALNSLKDIPCDVIKVDMGFLRKSQNVEQSNIILEMVLRLIKRLEKQIVTEGVETIEQVDYLKNLGCDIFQGYYYSRPVPVREFEAHVLEKVENE